MAIHGQGPHKENANRSTSAANSTLRPRPAGEANDELRCR